MSTFLQMKLVVEGLKHDINEFLSTGSLAEESCKYSLALFKNKLKKEILNIHAGIKYSSASVISDFQAKLYSSDDVLRTFEEKVNSLKQDLTDLEQECRDKEDHLQSELANKDIIVEKLRFNLEQLNSDRRSCTECESLSRQLRTIEDYARQTEGRITDICSKFDEIEQSKKLQMQVSALEESIRTREDEVSMLLEKIRTLQSEQMSKQDSFETLARNFQLQIEILCSQLEEKENLLSSEAGKLYAAGERTDELCVQLSSYKGDLQAAQNRVQELEAQSALSSSLCCEEINRLRAEQDDLKQLIEDTRDKVRNRETVLAEQNEAHSMELSLLKSTQQNLEAKLTESEIEKGALTKELNEMQQKYQGLECIIRQLSLDKSGLEDLNEKLLLDIDQLRSQTLIEVENAQQESKLLNAELDQRDKDISTLKNTIDAHSERGKVDQTCIILRVEIEKLRDHSAKERRKMQLIIADLEEQLACSTAQRQ
jgi:chromosome segregation ATPase